VSPSSYPPVEFRQARPEDYEAVAAFTRDTWPDRDGRDYIPRIYHDWIDGDGATQRTFVADAGDETGATPSENVAGIVQGVLLSEHEAWAQGMRVNPDYRGQGLSTALNEAVFDWAAERGAVACRNMVFSWNTAGLGGLRAAGFDPATEFRWAHPEPDADADAGGDGDVGDARVVPDPDAAWHYWTGSDARDALRGLALDGDESWAVSELTRADLWRAADETAVFAVQRSDGRAVRRDDGRARGTRGLAYRVRDYERETDDGRTERWAEYGVGAWADVEAARALFAAVARDAAGVDADRTRVLIPERPRHVTDAAWARAGVSDEPVFAFEADLSSR